jgi:hypothetical protein
MAAPGSPAPEPPEAEVADDDREHFGPLALRRLTKDDGRSLILYERAASEEDASAGVERR